MVDKIAFTAIPDSVDNALKNITDKPTKSIGETLSEIFYLTIGGPIHQAALKRGERYAVELEKFQQELQEKVSEIPKENFTEPDLQVAATAFQNVRFCMEEIQLRAMFLNLISASADSTKAKSALPIFSDIILKMTSRDASNLASFGNVANYPIAIYREWFGNTGYFDVMKNVFLHNKKYSDLREQSISVVTLCSLGLTTVDYSKKFDSNSYNDFYKTSDYAAFLEMCEKHNTMEIPEDLPECVRNQLHAKSRLEVIGGMIELTDLGSEFKRICIPDAK